MEQDIIIKKTRKSYSQEELDKARLLFEEHGNVEVVAKMLERNPASLQKKLIEEGVINIRTEKQDEFEYRLAAKIEQYWHDKGYHNVRVSQDQMGRPRSNLISGMPRDMLKWGVRRP